MMELRCEDGAQLAAELYGDPATARAGLVIAPAMGVAQRFYADFARWMASQGFVVLSFDYRGIGASRPSAFKASLRGFETDIPTWAKLDAACALAEMQRLLGDDRPLHWLGHSLGSQIVGMLPGRERITSVVTIAGGSGYWRENAAQLKRYVWLLWWVFVPVLVPLFGYFPGKRLRMVGDLPRGVIRQWRRWCLHPDYLMGEGGSELRSQYAAFKTRILSLSFTDDEFMSRRNIESLHGFYSSADVELRRIAPADVGARRIGHMGFFRAPFQSSLWPQAAKWLQGETA